MVFSPAAPVMPFGIEYRDDRIGAEERARLMADPGFGRVLTEHMVTIRWTAERGWHGGRVGPYGGLSLDPATIGLHYGQIVFEGLKAYAQPNGEVGVFRPDAAAERLRQSARRLAMPELPERLFVQAIEELVRADREWVPEEVGKSLYLRPVVLATEADLGLHPAREYLFLLIAFVTDRFFSGPVRPLSVWLCEDYSRAAPGGTGMAKCPGNYAASLLAQQQAHERGCDQVIWLDAARREWVEEMGGMNIFFVMDRPGKPELVTPELGDTILPGITRDSLLVMARDRGYTTTERPFSVAEWRAACADGTMLEAFACGTAAVVAPIGTVQSEAGDWTVGNGGPGPLTLGLREALVDIHHGIAPDSHGWIHSIR
ncbi:branched-chain amino acid aminotransferase [Actinomadura sp. NTSP31]|uniref:branched-chain amino acid aminotransferase n=1 Tax=Actinomadura sp. NTSP31 TaxID=1735447 RepID=UPI0035C1A787